MNRLMNIDDAKLSASSVLYRPNETRLALQISLCHCYIDLLIHHRLSFADLH